MDLAQNIIKPSKEMNDIFIQRSEIHRSLVKNNLLLMRGYLDISLKILNNRAEHHDISKYKEPERTAYIWMTWKYYCTNNGIVFDYPAVIKNRVTHGWRHHIVNNAHHPEFHVYPDKMSMLDIVEMVCDWSAIAEENNNDAGNCMRWALMNIDKKWNFSLEKKNSIIAVIEELNYRRGKL